MDARLVDPRVVQLRSKVVDLMERLGRAADSEHGLPDVETVHRLRTGTRRCGALLQSLLVSPARNTAIPPNDARKLLQLWKGLRRAAGAVRDLDVQRELLEEWQKSEAGSADSAGAHVDALQQQGTALTEWLARSRHAAAIRLQHDAAKRLSKCRKVLLAVLPSEPEAAVAAVSGRSSWGASPAVLALEDFCRASLANPVLERDNLHDFRKLTKQARYVAEAGGDDAHARLVGRALKRIQDSIGAWHDLDSLALTAKLALGRQGQGLRARLEAKAEARLHEAIESTERARSRLMGEYLAVQPQRVRRRAGASGSQRRVEDGTPQAASRG